MKTRRRKKVDQPVDPGGNLISGKKASELWRVLAERYFGWSGYDVRRDFAAGKSDPFKRGQRELLWNYTNRKLPAPIAGEHGEVENQVLDSLGLNDTDEVFLFQQVDDGYVYDTSIRATRDFFRNRHSWQDEDCYVVTKEKNICVTITHGRWDGKICVWTLRPMRVNRN